MKKGLLLLAALLIVGLLVAGLYWFHSGGDPTRQELCSAPNDALVPCDDLQRDPQRTDWLPTQP